jgi:hypothetical protein
MSKYIRIKARATEGGMLLCWQDGYAVTETTV